MRICTKLLSVEKKENYYSLQTDALELRVWFLTDEIIRIRAGFEGDFKEQSYSLVLTAWEDRLDNLLKEERKRIKVADSALKDLKDRISITGKKLSLVVYKEPFMCQILDEEGNVLHEDIPFMGWQKDSNGRIIHTQVMDKADNYYGFGERTGYINKREKLMRCAPGDAMGYNPKETDNLYKHIPFYIKLNGATLKACGYFYHTTEECEFNMGRTHSNYVKHHTQVRIDGGDLDLFFIAGPSMKEVIKGYTKLTGTSVLLPKSALGYLGSSMYYSELPENVDEEIISFINTARKEEIPIDGFQLSSGYCEIDAGEGMKRYTFTWNNDKFRNPKDFFEKMKALGITVSPNVKPGFLLSHPMHRKMSESGMFVKDSIEDKDAVGLWWGGMGNYVDLTSPKTREDWKKLLKENLIDYGVTSVWNDNCEYEGLFDKDARVCLEGEGSTIGKVKPVMSNLMCQLSNESVEEVHANERPFSVCRSGHCGIQRYAQVWAGDNLTCWDSLKYNIATILGMGLSGVANHGCDIGGFYGPAPDEELFVRWVQNGIFQPRFSIHSTNTDNTVTEPWMYSGTKHLIKDAICFRYRLNPYFYSLLYRANQTGLPIMESMALAFQNDCACFNEGVDFMLGEGLLVANVVEKGATSRRIYLPKDEIFYDFYSREEYRGGQTIEIPVSLASIPLFIRGGSIIPMDYGQMMNLAKDTVSTLKLLVAPDFDTEFVLYDDDGKTFNYKNGEYLKTKISLKTGEVVSLDFENEGSYISPVKKIYVDMIARKKAPYFIKLREKNGADEITLKHYLNRSDFNACEEGWYYSQTKKSVQIKYNKPGSDYKLYVSFENFDLIGM